MQAALGLVVQRAEIGLIVRNQLGAVCGALFHVAQRVDFKTNVVDPKRAKNPRRHDHDLSVNVRPVKAKTLHIELTELTLTALLRPLMAEHLSHRINAHRPVVSQTRVDRRTHEASGELRPQSELFAVQFVFEGIHFLLDNIGDFTN